MPIQIQINMPQDTQAALDRVSQQLQEAFNNIGKGLYSSSPHLRHAIQLDEMEARIYAVCSSGYDAGSLIALCHKAKQGGTWFLHEVYDKLCRGETPDEVRYWLWRQGIYRTDELKVDEPEDTFFK